MDNVELSEPEEYKSMLKQSFIFLGIYLLVAIFMIGLFWLHPAFILSFVWGHVEFLVGFIIALFILALMAALEPFGGLAALVGVGLAIIMIWIILLAYMWASGLFSLGV